MQTFVLPLLGPREPSVSRRAATQDGVPRRPFEDELQSRLSRSDERATARRTDKPPRYDARPDPLDSAVEEDAPEPVDERTDVAPRSDASPPDPGDAEAMTQPAEAPPPAGANPSRDDASGEVTASSATVAAGAAALRRLLPDLGILTQPSGPSGTATPQADAAAPTATVSLPSGLAAVSAAASTVAPVVPGSVPQVPAPESAPTDITPTPASAAGNPGLLDGGDGQGTPSHTDAQSESTAARRPDAPSSADAQAMQAAAKPLPTVSGAAPSTIETLRASVIESYDSAASDQAVDPTGRDNDSSEPLATQVARELVTIAEPTTDAAGTTTSGEVDPQTEPVAPVAETSPTAPDMTHVTSVDRTPTGPGAPTAPQAPFVQADDANVENIVKALNGTVGAREGRIRLQLDPPELGQMRIDVRVHKDVLTLRIQVESEAALARIQATASQLKHALEHNGLVVERFDVQLRGTESSADRSGSDDRGDFRSADQHQAFEHERSEDRDPSAGAGTPDDASEPPTDDLTLSTETAPSRRAPTAAAVDLWA